MNKPYQFKNFEILPFDFSNNPLIDEAICLLNAETTSKKHNRAFWDWKFLNNPFGPSVGWYARENDTKKLAGVLLWWPWKFYNLNQEVIYYQAINGKTDSEYRNAGIFLELNRVAIDFFRKGSNNLYGVPNNQSYPSYVKLGWETISTLNPVYIAISPIKTFLKILYNRKQVDHKPTVSELAGLRFEADNKSFLSTKWNQSLIEWRFLKHPNNTYSFYRDGENFIVYKINSKAKFIEAKVIMTSITQSFELKHFFNHLNSDDIDFVSYYGCNTLFYNILNKQVKKYRVNKNRLFFVVNKNIAGNSSYRFELAATDSQ